MSVDQCAAPPLTQTSVETWSDVRICDALGECRVVQVISRYWLYDDGSYVLSIHRADDPMSGSSFGGNHADGLRLLETRTNEMWRLAGVA